MKLTYLGTAAAEGWPALFCRCEYCCKALERGGRNLRTRSQALVNDDLLLDFPGDALSHMQQNGLDFSAVRWLLVTHSHMDHFSPNNLHLRPDGCYARNRTSDTLELYGNQRVLELWEKERATRPEEPNDPDIISHLAVAYEPFSCGRYRVTPLPANHEKKEKPLVYLIEADGKAMLYLHDTGLLCDGFYDYLREHRVHADLISYDCTFVALPSCGGHLGLDTCQQVRARLEEIGVSDGKTVSVINHFSHNGKLIYDELVPVADKLGFLVSYDGMTVDF